MDYDYALCSNWIKLSGLAPMMRLYFKNYTDVRIIHFFYLKNLMKIYLEYA